MAAAAMPTLLETEPEIVTSSHVVDVKSVNMLDSESWNEILDAVSTMYLSVNPNSPTWLKQREELSHYVISLSSEPLTAAEMASIATEISKQHGFNNACSVWAKEEAKWLLKTLNQAKSLMDAFMLLPAQLKLSPGTPAPDGHSLSGCPMRISFVHIAFVVLAGHRRVGNILTMIDKGKVQAASGSSDEPLEQAASSDPLR
jgi:hypothetical protein